MRKVMPTQKSWSELCRERVDHYVEQINAHETTTVEWVVRNLRNSYRPPIFRYRCAKLLRRAIKNGRVK